MPEWRQTDNSTAATHRIPDAKSAVADGSTKRPFNDDYLAIMRHFGMKPRTTTVGAKEQNGDVQAANGVLKRALEQSLLLRGTESATTSPTTTATGPTWRSRATRRPTERSKDPTRVT